MYFKPVHQKQEMIKFKDVFNLSNQLSNFSRNWDTRDGKTKFHKVRGLTFTTFLQSKSINGKKSWKKEKERIQEKFLLRNRN